ncbi:DUF2255 family protein [Paractinoplanes rishiriensis]|uniref:DUF2255 family protein n=1 Tax=Paractinoplanes rishiriensis TaxID=1050105 RepID=A0A919N2J2_9ACTN|nr:DUF2255 family protein [Actinoplanes rishiriensis]GIF00418.1 hypothetical protein Ari01nite_78820 [Actinoplanes rishiriensis]
MAWDAQTLDGLADAREIDLIVPAPGRPVVRVPVWVVAVGGELYVRSWKGDAGLWYRRARRHGAGSVAADGREHPVRFVGSSDPALDAAVDKVFLTKYADSETAVAMTRPPAAGTTLRLEPLT